jgi:hypothetical protein
MLRPIRFGEDTLHRAIAAVCGFVGIFCFFISAVLDNALPATLAGYSVPAILVSHPHSMASFSAELGVALFILGSIGLLLETPKFEHYYLNKIRTVLNESEYREALADTVLTSSIPQRKQYPTPDLAATVAINAILSHAGREFNDKVRPEIEDLIGEEKNYIAALTNGYKSNMAISLVYTQSDEADVLDVVDETRYILRHGFNKKMLPLVYGADADEIVSAQDIKFEYQLKDGDFPTNALEPKDERLKETCLDKRFDPWMEKEVDIADGATVIITAKYKMRRDSLFFAKSESSIHGYTVRITPPNGYVAKFAVFMRDKQKSEGYVRKEGNTLIFQTALWARPNQGIGWVLVPEAGERRYDSAATPKPTTPKTAAPKTKGRAA